MQVQKADQHPDDTGSQEKDTAFNDDTFPDDRQEIVGNRERIEEDVPKGTLDKGRIAEDQQGNADDNHQDGSPVTTAGDGGEHEGEGNGRAYGDFSIHRKLLCGYSYRR